MLKASSEWFFATRLASLPADAPLRQLTGLSCAPRTIGGEEARTARFAPVHESSGLGAVAHRRHAALPHRRWPVGTRGMVILGLLLAAAWACWHLNLGADEVLPSERGWDLAGRFASAALSPALTYQGEAVVGRPPILVEALEALGKTILLAAAAVALALMGGMVLGFFASTAWWAGDTGGGQSWWVRVLRRSVFPAVYTGTRVLIAVMRSIHELFWALLFMASIGLTEAAAVLALSIPYAGIFAKIFSEMIDEAPRSPAYALRAAGAHGLHTYAIGLLPAALPDMLSYTFYRFECAIRSSAIIGFFGIETIGYHIKQSFDSTYFNEVWTYLYVLIATILVFDAWSGAVRRRLVG